MLCSGLNNYIVAPGATPFRLGGFELVDLKDNRPVGQGPVELWSPSGLPMSQNPVFVEATETAHREGRQERDQRDEEKRGRDRAFEQDHRVAEADRERAPELGFGHRPEDQSDDDGRDRIIVAPHQEA